MRSSDSPRRKIGEEADDMADLSPRIAHSVQLQPLRVQLAVLAGFHQFALPAAVLLQRLVNRSVVSPRIATAGQLDDVAPEHVFDLIAGDAAEGLIDRDQGVIGVENHDAFAGRLEHRRRQSLLFFERLAGADVATGADHADHPAVFSALHRSAAVFDPHPVAVAWRTRYSIW
jgi:hypothetical protein